MKHRYFRLLYFGLVLVVTSNIFGAENKSATVSQGALSASVAFSGTKTSDAGHVRNLIVGTADQGGIHAAWIAADAENNAWVPSGTGLPNYQVRFTGTQKAGADATKATKQYVPKFEGRASPKGSGGSSGGTPTPYTWNVTATYTISDHDPIVEDREEIAANGSVIAFGSNGTQDQDQWKNYTYTNHEFDITDDSQTPPREPQDIPIVDIPSFIKIPGSDKGDAVCFWHVIPQINPAPPIQGFIRCDICKANNKYRYVAKLTGTISGPIKIVMPKWTDIGNPAIVGPKTETRWKTWWDSLYAHEKKHWDIVVDHLLELDEFVDAYRGKRYIVEVCRGVNKDAAKEEAVKKGKDWEAKTKKEIDDKCKEIFATCEKAQDDFDEETDHGAKEGVKFGFPQGLEAITN